MSPQITIRRSQNLIGFEAPSFSFTGRLIDFAYPEYEAAIPAPASNSVTCDRLNLIASLSRLSAVAQDTDLALVALSWGSGGRLDLHLARSPLDGADVIGRSARKSRDRTLAPTIAGAAERIWLRRHPAGNCKRSAGRYSGSRKAGAPRPVQVELPELRRSNFPSVTRL